MKKLLVIALFAGVFTACNNETKEEAPATETPTETMTPVVDSAAAAAAAAATPVVDSAAAAAAAAAPAAAATETKKP